MRDAAANLEFEEAARLRDEIRRLEADESGAAQRRTFQSFALSDRIRRRRGTPEERREISGSVRQRGGAVDGEARESVKRCLYRLAAMQTLQNYGG